MSTCTTMTSWSSFRSRFHGRSRRHHEDADTFADALAELCRVGYPQSPAELRQELIAEQFVRGQSDPELKKYLWVVIRTQKDRKLQTLIEVCTNFSSLSAPAHLHRPAEQTFAVHQQMDAPYMEDDSEAVFAVGDHPPWTNRRPPEAPGVPTLQQILLWLDGWGMRCALSVDSQMPRDNNLEVDHLLIRTGDFVPNHGLDAITLKSIVSVVDSLDTCNHVVHTRIFTV